MGFVMAEVVLQRVIVSGIKSLRANRTAFDDIFEQYVKDEMTAEYGQTYLDQLWTWFSTTKIPVVQAWSFNAQKIPCISIHLATETEAEDKAAIGDYAGTFDDVEETLTGAFTVMLDIGIHANKAGDHVLWLYYIISYILFKNKLMANRLGLRLHTFSASDYSKENKYMGENIWTRWIRFRCTTQNFLGGQELSEIDDISIDPSMGNEPASDIAASLDVDISTIDTTANPGIRASRTHDIEGEEDVNI